MIEIAFACSIALNVSFAAVILKITLSGFARLSESHERTTNYTESLIDRLMANDYSNYQDRQLALTMATATQQDKLSDDPEDDFRVVDGPDRGGFGSRLGLIALSHDTTSAAEVEAELLARGDS